MILVYGFLIIHLSPRDIGGKKIADRSDIKNERLLKVNQNKRERKKRKKCPVTLCMDVIGGKWKPIILNRVSFGDNRFGLLLKEIEGINKQMLSKQLRELERDGILERTIFPEIPPRVEYTMTLKGKSLMPVVHAMGNWGKEVIRPSKLRSKVNDKGQLPLFEQ
ncbi:MAG: winged helix-turn-helix transcriptional regulator [Flavobacteriaceae bacterium]